jgi:predicted SAM-dependent methyltransferase
MKLDIGCGRTPIAGYIGVDVIPEVNPTIVAPMWNIPVADGEVTHIYSSHALEHVEKRMVIPTLKEWNRLLRSGGLVELRVPDLEWCCRNWLEHMTNDWHMDTIYGNQEHEGEFHKTGFTHAIMLNYLTQAGLVLDNYTVMQTHNQNTLVFHARKP